MVNNGVISAPIDFSDPYNCMGVAAQSNGYDVGYICGNGHGKINKWAKYKPIRVNQASEINDTLRYSANQGIDPETIHGTLEEVMSMGSSGTAWNYLPPTSSYWFRLNDFISYNHYAVAPYNRTSIPSSGTTTGTTASFDWRVTLNSSAEFDITDMAVYDNYKGSLSMYYFFVCKKGSSYCKSSYVNADSASGKMIFSITFPSVGTWQCALVCANSAAYSEDIASMTDLLLMPGMYFTFQLTKQSAWIYATLQTTPSIYYDSSTYEMNFGTSYFTIQLSATQSTGGYTYLQFGFTIWGYTSDGDQIAYAEVYDTDEQYGYSGTPTVTWNMVDFPQTVNLAELIDTGELEQVSYFIVRPDIKVVSGTGAPSWTTDKSWTVYV